MNTRTRTLEAASALINGERQSQYGTPQENFACIAAMWTAYLDAEAPLTPADVANMMALLKVARLRNGAHLDSCIDGAGYLALSAELAEGG